MNGKSAYGYKWEKKFCDWASTAKTAATTSKSFSSSFWEQKDENLLSAKTLIASRRSMATIMAKLIRNGDST